MRGLKVDHLFFLEAALSFLSWSMIFRRSNSSFCTLIFFLWSSMSKLTILLNFSSSLSFSPPSIMLFLDICSDYLSSKSLVVKPLGGLTLIFLVINSSVAKSFIKSFEVINPVSPSYSERFCWTISSSCEHVMSEICANKLSRGYFLAEG